MSQDLNDGDYRVVWSPGKAHPQWPNVVAGTTERNMAPAPGYKWLNDTSGDFRVIPANARPTNFPNVIEVDDKKYPVPGYKWLNDTPDDFRVVKVD